ncbi:MAG: SDR family NAD(P)-dependent oxidoreductase [Actinomycetota bacterium]|nr:SDR family NAD(P)-dependent oxidoreductase [Actinomycetota bacterium]
MNDSKPLAGRVAVVTGASRGIGKGIAIGLGEAGATVYVTGRTTGDGDRTINRTAELVSQVGGQGIAVEIDHALDQQIDELFQIVESDHDGLDILVNNVFKIPDPPAWEGGFWEHPLAIWDDQVGIGLRSHYVAARRAVPLLLKREDSMIFNITSPAGLTYLFNAAYSIGKAGLDRMTHDLGFELLEERVAVIGLRPGPTRTEFIEDQASAGVPVLTEGVETPVYVGRVTAAVAGDTDRLAMTGRVHWTTDLGDRYGAVDEDGNTPMSAPERFKDAPRADPYASEPMFEIGRLGHGGVARDD